MNPSSFNVLILLLLLSQTTFGQSDEFRIWGSATGHGADAGVVFNVNQDGSDYTIAKSFAQNLNGANPNGRLIKLLSGELCGFTRNGGAHGFGTVFKINPDGSSYTKLLDFNGFNGEICIGLTQLPDGSIIGITQTGGADFGNPFGSSLGVIFKVEIDGSGYKKIFEFRDYSIAAYPRGGLLHATNGLLYGVSEGGSNQMGVVFSINPDGTGFKKLIDFDGANKGTRPFGNLFQASDGDLFGVTEQGGSNPNGGVLFKLNLDGSVFTKVVDFDNNVTKGLSPQDGLLQLSDGFLYGITSGGGSQFTGNIYRVKPNGSDFEVLKEFNSMVEGYYPRGGLIVSVDGYLTGVATGGGTNQIGTLFKLKTDGTNFTKLFDFSEVFDGFGFPSSLTLIGDDLFGTTYHEGASNNGIIYKFSSANTFTKLFEYPQEGSGSSNLNFDQNGDVIGLTEGGGLYARGKLFRIQKNGEGYTPLFDFGGDSGGMKLVQGSDGDMYGSQQQIFGGSQQNFFKINNDGTDYTRLYSTSATEGVSLSGDMIQNNDGFLYGMMQQGGTNNFGVIFKLKSDGTSYSKLFDFDNTNGRIPQNGLMKGTDSFLYGMTAGGGLYGKGVIFKIRTDGSDFIKLMDFDGAMNGQSPYGNLVQASNGKIFGTVSFGGQGGYGLIFSINPDGTNFSKLHNFSLQSGIQPIGIYFGPDGNLYGTTTAGGDNYGGVLFTIRPDGTGYKKIISFDGRTPNPKLLFTSKTSQTISFEDIPDKIIGGNPFTLISSSSASLPVQFSTASDKISINNNLVTMVKPGSVTILAKQPGNVIYKSVSLSRTFCVNPAKPTITVSDLNTDSPKLTSSNSAGNQWYLNGVAIAGAASSSFTAKESGIYTVKTTVDDCSSEFSAERILIVTGDIEHESKEEIQLYPNPAKNEIWVVLESFEKGAPVQVAIFDLNGRKIDNKSGIGGKNLVFDLKHYSTGKYILKAEQKRKTLSRQFIKE